MSAKHCGIADRVVAETPIAVLDVETTGLTPGRDRIVEFSVIRKEPGADGGLVLDTLVNPQRSMAATEIHGVTDDDVADAPAFNDIVGDVVHALSDCVVASYNIYFDMPFLEYELRQAGIDHSLPHFCLMYLRPMLGLGKRCALGDACLAHGIHHNSAHVAAADAQAATQLMGVYLEEMRARDIETFADLAQLKAYKFVKSFDRTPLVFTATEHPRDRVQLKSRGTDVAVMQGIADVPADEGTKDGRQAVGAYWDALKAVICDLEVTDDEICHLEEKKRALGVSEEQIRALHARAFANVISQFVDDQRLDDRECKKLRRLFACLSQLGWAPGE